MVHRRCDEHHPRRYDHSHHDDYPHHGADRGYQENRRAVADQLHSAAIHLLRTLRKTDAATGISPSRLSALSVLVFGGPRSLRELAEAERIGGVHTGYDRAAAFAARGIR